VNVFWQMADGSGDAEQLTMGQNTQLPFSWSPDGRTLALVERTRAAGLDINVISPDGERNPRPFLQTPFNEDNPVFSPDGRWLAYQSDESGHYEVYLRPFPSAEGKRQVSTGGGIAPVWNPSGDELFYISDDKMMAVDVRMEGVLELGEPRVLFEQTLATANYDVTPDGQRFVLILSSESEPAKLDLILVQNWTEELTKLVPTDN